MAGIGLKDGAPLREDWFPVVWRQGDGARGPIVRRRQHC
jgi:hypothetical protein